MLQRKAWRRAARHYLGIGLQQGAELKEVTAKIRRWRACGRNEDAGVLAAIITGGVWHAARRLTCNMVTYEDALYKRCGKEVGSALHR